MNDPIEIHRRARCIICDAEVRAHVAGDFVGVFEPRTDRDIPHRCPGSAISRWVLGGKLADLQALVARGGVE